MENAIFFAIISPFIWGFVNIFDKYITEKKVKNPISFTVVGGITGLFIILIILPFLDWSNISIKDMFFPIIIGLLYSVQLFLYYSFLKKEDASSLVGFVYTYPIIIAILSFIFLEEKLSITGYIGIALILTGILMLSIRLNRIKIKVAIWTIITIILITSFYEFFIKISTQRIPEINGLAIQMLIANAFTLCALLNKKTRKDITKEFRNIKWAISTEFLTLFATLTIYLAMSGLSATVVASISSIQPLIVIFYERIADKLFGKMHRDRLLLPRLGAIILIVMGVVLLYTAEII